ncbi:MAG: histidinol-phosphate transaminase [Gammaproteobacteria bacterium]|nr:histidinol-phosphate transaminase [Gammaproteobacteria bacterium]
MTSTVKPLSHVLAIEPYLPGDSAVPGVSRVIKMSSNESPLGSGPAARQAAEGAMAELERYPESSARILREALAERYGLDAQRIVCEAGSEQLINLIARCYAGPGDEILFSAHGFVAYKIAALSCGAKPVAAPEKSLTTDVDALLGLVSEHTRILFLANPNNPTGTCLPMAEITRLREELPESVLLVLDGAYAEYVEKEDYSAGLEMVNEYPGNVVVLRTFSKIYGLAALRVGWSYSSRALAMALHRLRGVFTVSTIAQKAAVAAVIDLEHENLAREHNALWRPWLNQQLSDLGLTMTDSHGNFVLARFASQEMATEADFHLRSNGVITRTLREYGLGDCLRITVGLEEHNHLLVSLLKEFLAAS